MTTRTTFRAAIHAVALGFGLHLYGAEAWIDISTSHLDALKAKGMKQDWPGGCSGVVVNRLTGDITMKVVGLGLWRSVDRGVTWKRVDDGTISGRDETGWGTSVDANDPRRIASFSLDGLAGMSPDGLRWRSFTNNGRNWDYGSVDWTAAAPLTILAAKHETTPPGEVDVSSDGGSSWRKLPIALAENRNSVSMVGVMGSNILVYSNGDGILRSTDTGLTWSRVSDANPQTRIPVWFRGVHYLGTTNGLLASRDKGATWQPQGARMSIWQGPFFGKDETAMVVVGEAGIHETRDSGKTWTRLAPLKPNGAGFSYGPKWFGCYAWDPIHRVLYASAMGNPVYKLEIGPEMVVSEAQRNHWSYRPLAQPAPPDIKAADNPVDRFVLSRLRERGLRPGPRASAGTIVRRLYFDLIGLPPTPAQVETFLQASQRDPGRAVESLVDELLASPHHGERWARHWLDVARYADSDGQEGDLDRPTAHHYRDFVIQSLNEDLPFDTFVRWQLAGDELEPDNPRALAATGFIVAGPHSVLPDTLMEEERTRTRFNELDDMISTTGAAMLGLTLGCARCHDHKYDPVPRRDYYQLLSAFNGGDRSEVPLVPPDVARRHREAQAAWKVEHSAASSRVRDFSKAARKRHENEVRRAKVDALKASTTEKTLLLEHPEEREAKEVGKRFSEELKQSDTDWVRFASSQEREEWHALGQALDQVKSREPKPLPTALGFADFGPQPRETLLLARGDFRAKGEPVELGFLTALTRGRSPGEYLAAARASSRRTDSTQQRRAVAEWLTDLDHGAGALVARVMVNRVWQHHFGQGLVRTVNDFGSRADPPTHPELLEWLAAEFVKGGWKLKTLHRILLTSDVYLQDTGFDEANAALDPENRLLWRRRPLRMESEILRDSMLAVGGVLNTQRFGPAFKAPVPPEAIQARNMKDAYPKDLVDGPATRRRSVYMFHKRVVQQPLMQAFDGPDAQASCGRRENTTVAPQALALLNDRFVRSVARDFAARVFRQAGSEPGAQVREAWKLALGRDPSREEADDSVAFLRSQTDRRSGREPAAEPAGTLAMADLCQAIFALNEFIYID